MAGQVVAYMLDLLHDKNSEIRKMSDTTLVPTATIGHNHLGHNYIEL